MKILLFIVFVILVIIGCNSNLARIEAEPTNYPEGKLIFLNKCSGCHRLYERDHLSAAGWDSIMVPMQKNAKLNDEQKNKVLQYLKENKQITKRNSEQK